MTEYLQFLMAICFTMVTGVVIVGCFGLMMFWGLLLWNMVLEEFN